ncbi:acyl-CoA dehydrogenase family protein [Aeromicrobium massiliense]|uniref:acyl-CoA dehydrogenase family protein n=1 Tax=Aeromicrobium massiliense TaxID=1464554 RepID=UPI0002E4BAB3|nr:acyl-CoA dehydrogenase family protein [Aeromicrobium massiliense]
MNPWTTPERAALRDMVRDFTTKEIVPNLRQWEDEGRLPRDLHLKAAKAGLMGIGFPEAVGGSGGDLVDTTIVTETIIQSGGSSGLVAALFTHGIALPHIVANGSPDLIDEYVRPTLAGEKIGSLGVTEPDGGSDVANLRTRARKDGTDYVVDGAKTFITSGVRSDFVTTAVRTGDDGWGGISLVVIDKGLDGFDVSGPLAKMGWHCSDTAELAFSGVRVPQSKLVGEENAGFVYVMQQFVVERLSLATQGYATAQRALDLAVDYARTRETFGRPLIKRQAIRHRLVEMHQKVEAARAVTRQAVEAQVSGEKDDLQMSLVASTAKNVAVEACEWVVSQAVQIHGGAGYMRDSEIDRHYRDARILGIGGGATEVMKDLSAKLLGY